jgi:protein involved in polysaccharide export with SLBB domain
VNFAKCGWCASDGLRVCRIFMTILMLLPLSACSDQVRLPSAEELAQFERAGPSRPTVDTSTLTRARTARVPDRVLPGEVLELTMPTLLKIIATDEPGVSNGTTPFLCRVTEQGSITLPVVGEIEVAGKSLGQIEAAVASAYHPKYTRTPPYVFARVIEHRTARVTIQGAVVNPGVYNLRSDQMSVLGLLMVAGGIVDEGAGLIRVHHSEQPSSAVSEGQKATDQIVLPVKGLNTLFFDVALQEGDSVFVDRLWMPLFSVVGLVRRPGNFSYPPRC